MKRREGFTLIELMIVVVIIGILVTIAVPNFMRMRDNAKEGKAKSTAHTVQLVAEDYAVRNEGVYSDVAGDLQPLMPGAALVENAFTGNFTEPQFAAVAATAGQIGIQAVVDPTGASVGYRVTCFGKTENILTLTNGD